MRKTLNQLIFFSSTKIRIFFFSMNKGDHKSYITTNIQQAEHLHSIPPSLTVRGPSSLGVADLNYDGL
jgi:hypothetical protein